MSCDTILRLKGHITAEQIVDYIDEHYKFISNSIREDNYVTSGFIKFNDGDENRNIYYDYQNINSYEKLDENIVKSETTFLDLGCYGNSVEIMKGIAQEFGGWLDENDCDDIPPYWIDKVDKTRYCWSSDGEHYNGSFDTEQETIEDAKETVNDAYEEIYVGTCKEPVLSWNSNEEKIIESIYDNLYDECGEVSEIFEITREQELELANRIDKCVEQWINDMKIKPNCWTVVNEHLVSLR